MEAISVLMEYSYRRVLAKSSSYTTAYNNSGPVNLVERFIGPVDYVHYFTMWQSQVENENYSYFTVSKLI